MKIVIRSHGNAVHQRPVRKIIGLEHWRRKLVVERAMQVHSIEWVGKSPRAYTAEVLGSLPRCVLSTACDLLHRPAYTQKNVFSASIGSYMR